VIPVQQTTRKPKKKHRKNIARKIRKFSQKNIADMLALSANELNISKMDLKLAKSLQIPWSKLKKILVRGLRGPDITRYF
jgi:hypothetical protein